MTRITLPLALLLACTAAPPPPPPTPTAAPPPSPAQILVYADSPGAAPLVVESSVTTPLEHAVASTPGLVHIRSESRSGTANLTLTFAPGTDLQAAQLSVQSLLQATLRTLPAGVIPYLRIAPDPRVAQLFILQSSQLTPAELGRAAEKIREALQTVPGVLSVDLCGRRRQQLTVTLDLARLTAYALTPAAILTTLRTTLTAADLPGLRIAAPTPDSLGDVVLSTQGPQIRLRDLATVELTAPPDTCAAIRVGGTPAILGLVHARPGTPADTFDNSIHTALEAQRATFPAGALELETPTIAPLRILVDIEATADPATTLAVQSAILEKNLLGAHLSVRAYLQAPLLDHPGQRTTGDLFILPTSPEHAASLRDALPQLQNLGPLGTLADPTADPQLHKLWISGPDLDTNRQLADHLINILRTVPGVTRTRTRDDRSPEFVLDIQQDRLAALGLRPSDVHATLALALAGSEVGALTTGTSTTKVLVRLPTDPTTSNPLATLAAVPLTPATGGPAVRLDALVTVRTALEPATITHTDQRRATAVELYYSDRQAREAAEKTVARDLRLPPGFTLEWD